MQTKVACVCPKCKRNNNVNISTELYCKYCDESLTGKTYIQKPWWLTPAVAVLLTSGGTIGGYETYSKIHPNRYSIDEEYLIINACMTLDQDEISISDFRKKKEICICALEKTQESVKNLTNENKNEFLKVFDDKVDECGN